MRYLITILIFGFMSSVAAAAADAAELTTLEMDFWDAAKSRNPSFYAENMAVDAIRITGEGVVMGRDAIMQVEFACDLDDYEFGNITVRRIGSDVATVIYDATGISSCSGERVSFNNYSVSTYARQDDKWMLIIYQNSPIRE